MRWWKWLRRGHSDGQRSEGPPELFRVPPSLLTPHVAANRSQMEVLADGHQHNSIHPRPGARVCDPRRRGQPATSEMIRERLARAIPLMM